MRQQQTAACTRSLRSKYLFCTLSILTWCQANAFQFYLHAGERRCFTESAAPNDKVLGEYTVSTGKGTMPVDITVRMVGSANTLYTKQNVDHGKFAFIMPYDTVTMPHIRRAEMHRKLTEKIHQAVRENIQSKGQTLHGDIGSTGKKDSTAHHGRRLLSVEENHAPLPPKNEAKDHDAGVGHDENVHEEHSVYRKRHHYHRDREEHHKEDDGDDYDYEDELGDFEMDDYDGIEDEELDEEMERNLQQNDKLHGRFDDASDREKEDRLFNVRKFEICISNNGEKSVYKRRVRLIVNKGDAAHDYTRLAKKEHMAQLEVSLRQVSSELHDLMHELDRVRMMEDMLRKRNENTNKRVVFLSAISLFCLFSVGGYQAFYTKKFFKRKKIL